MRKSLSVDSDAHALRDVKEYAARANEINTDTLQMKLMYLDEMGSKFDYADKELYSLVLQRFLCNKSQPRIGHLVTSLLCSPGEARVYEKEQKFLKLHGKPEGQITNDSSQEKMNNPNLTDNTKQPLDQFAMMLQFMNNFMPPPLLRYPRPSRPFVPTQRRGVNNIHSRPGQSYSGCHICGDLSHFQVDCPRKH